MKINFYPALPGTKKNTSFEWFQSSPARPSDKTIITMKKCVLRLWNNRRGEKEVLGDKRALMPLRPPPIPRGLYGNRNGTSGMRGRWNGL